LWFCRPTSIDIGETPTDGYLLFDANTKGGNNPGISKSLDKDGEVSILEFLNLSSVHCANLSCIPQMEMLSTWLVVCVLWNCIRMLKILHEDNFREFILKNKIKFSRHMQTYR